MSRGFVNGEQLAAMNAAAASLNPVPAGLISLIAVGPVGPYSGGFIGFVFIFYPYYYLFNYSARKRFEAEAPPISFSSAA